MKKRAILPLVVLALLSSSSTSFVNAAHEVTYTENGENVAAEHEAAPASKTLDEMEGAKDVKSDKIDEPDLNIASQDE
jgi:hypothetical protein